MPTYRGNWTRRLHMQAADAIKTLERISHDMYCQHAIEPSDERRNWYNVADKDLERVLMILEEIKVYMRTYQSTAP